MFRERHLPTFHENFIINIAISRQLSSLTYQDSGVGGQTHGLLIAGLVPSPLFEHGNCTFFFHQQHLRTACVVELVEIFHFLTLKNRHWYCNVDGYFTIFFFINGYIYIFSCFLSQLNNGHILSCNLVITEWVCYILSSGYGFFFKIQFLGL